ncbi:MAG: hypothetical protein WCX29_03970 [Candidatus Peribacteraceae bacterium]
MIVIPPQHTMSSNALPQPGVPDDERLSEEEEQLVLALQRSYASQMRNAALSDEEGRMTERSLHAVINSLRDRGNDPELVPLVHDFLRELNRMSSLGNSAGPLPESARKDIRAILIGATMALEARRDSQARTDQQPPEHVKDVSRFIELIESRVGRRNPDESKTVRMRIGENQASGDITLRKVPRP